MSSRMQQLLFVLGAVLLTIGLYLAPKKIEKAEVAMASPSFSFESLIEKAKQGLKRQEVEPISALEKEAKDNPADLSVAESLAKRWDDLHQPAISAHYYEAIAEKKQDEK